MTTVSVTLPETKYDVLIDRGLLKRVGELVSKQWSARKIALVSDDNVAPLYQKQVTDSLTSAGFDVHRYVFPAGEASKSLTVLADLARQMANDAFNRDDSVIALGGGVTGDLAGLLAATYMRGLSFIQIPTSLLAQVDSSVGGKTAVDLDNIKNIIGAFYEPDLVIVDPDTLATMKQRDLVEGYGEIVKTAALEGGDFWQLIETINSPADLIIHSPELSARSIHYKASVVMADETESGTRQLLNFGHTIGHAVEALADGGLRHGEAVSIGTVAIMRVFENAGLAEKGITAKLRDRFAAVGLPVTDELLTSPLVLDKVKNDKKNRHGHLNLVYLTAIGQPKIKSIPSSEIASFLHLSMAD
ncbi:3-dehydroquinate synthase [Lactobacillus sp. LC28-10]|uniref:3-dehydroquinate synthase n=1 Tax=Secundilactobacillus angelensis TaxID=2722706 RepID=A0ABX1L0Q2_9LACO|nr:3-dehydroquinate synthase [Secundilactobacillus angelensis]MCH5462928.1 3-dehydroquinate synthase [Secundilactobacillus angelensis]NLR18653.1 3-dehydroquinate synthase [Secundilactobacillus angelensis]